MKIFLRFLLMPFIFLLVISCSNSNSEQVTVKCTCQSIMENELIDNQVYIAIIKSNYIHPNDTIFDKKGRIVHIFYQDSFKIIVNKNTVSNSFIGVDLEYSLKDLHDLGFAMLTKEMLEHYHEINLEPTEIVPFNCYKGDIQYLTYEEASSKYSNMPVRLGPVDYDETQSYFGTGLDRPMIVFSKPGFNKDRSIAIVEYSIGYANCGALLALEDGCWIIKVDFPFILS